MTRTRDRENCGIRNCNRTSSWPAATDAPVFEGRLQTPDKEVIVQSVEGEVILETQVPTKDAVVRIWVNAVMEPDRVRIGVG